MNKEKKKGEPLVLTLCASCVKQFYNSPEHIVHRANLNQEYKETCCYCSYKTGWDYIITKK